MSVRMNMIVSKAINAAHAGIVLSTFNVSSPLLQPNRGWILLGMLGFQSETVCYSQRIRLI